MTPSRILLGIVAFAVALRLALGVLVPVSTESDSRAYLAMAASAAEGNGLVDVFGCRAFYSPGYPMLLAAVFVLTGPKLGAVLAVNVALAALSVLLVYRVARRAAETGKGVRSLFPERPGGGCAEKAPDPSSFPERPEACRTEKAATPLRRFSGPERAGLLAALAWAVYLPSVTMVCLIHKENLMVPLMLGVVWAALAWRGSQRRIGLAAVAGAMTGVLALVGATGCAVAGALVVVIVVYGENRRQRLAAGGAFLLAAMAFIAPWMARNYVVLGSPVMFTNAGFNMYLANNPAATGRFVCIGETPMRGVWNRIKAEQGEVAADREARRRAMQSMREHPGRTLALFLKKAVIFWEPPYLTSAEPEPLDKRLARYVWFAQYLVLLGLALAGLRHLRRTWPLYLAIALFAAIHVPFVVMLRYRLPIMAVLCACAFQWGGRRWKMGDGGTSNDESPMTKEIQNPNPQSPLP